jgi:hypothetical protein
VRKGFRLLTKLGICPAGKDRRAMKRPTRKEKACTSRCENRTGSAYGRAVSTSSTVTEADILAEIIAPDKPGLDPDAARAILRLQFNNHARERIRQLLDANNRGKISDAEHAELQKYLRVGQFIDLMQAKARLSFPESSPT